MASLLHSDETSARPQDVAGSYSSRAKHGSYLSISDQNHHVTEAIGDMYGDDDYTNERRDSRPLSFVTSPSGETVETSYFDSSRPTTPKSPSHVNGQRSPTLPGMSGHRGAYDSGPLSPTISLHSLSDSASQQFPLNDIDYESTPAAVQQEMHNLQALRRLSMGSMNGGDPDLPSFQSPSLMPSVAPTGGDDEDDPSRLYWVPARVHPELAPMEFKTFLETRVNSIKRHSGDETSLGAGLDRAPSIAGGLRRKKSMLSRQIDNSGGRGAIGYKDGAEQLERKKSLRSAHQLPEINLSDLQELDELVKDPDNALKKLSLDTNILDLGVDIDGSDTPILPAAPGGMGLKRSTHTTYRRGSLRRGERIPYSQRAKQRAGEDQDDSTSPSSPGSGSPLTRVPSEPIAENFSRPARARRGLNQQATSPVEMTPPQARDSDVSSIKSAPADMTPSQGPKREAVSRVDSPVPRIIETPPLLEPMVVQPSPQADIIPRQQPPQQHQSPASFPARSSSQPPIASQTSEEPPLRSNRRPPMARQQSSVQGVPQVAPAKTLDQMTQQPSPLMGSNSRTDSLTFIPTMPTEPEKPSSKKLKKEESDGSGKKTWGFFSKASKKDKEVEDKEAKKNKKNGVSDNTRLDVLQQTIDPASNRGRESVVLERSSLEPNDERPKVTGRKSSGEGKEKKEKDGLFSSLFKSSKSKSPNPDHSSKSKARAVSPAPIPARVLKPDIDYNWTRFSLLEERAIYRMAHIKLANPKRALYSQVLLSNFMYSYLAKVQQMHPNVQIPQSAAQRKQQEMEKRKREEEERRVAEEQYKYDYHQGIADYADQGDEAGLGQQQQHQNPNHAQYVDDAELYDHDHPNQGNNRGQLHQNGNYYGGQGDPNRKEDDNEMW